MRSWFAVAAALLAAPPSPAATAPPPERVRVGALWFDRTEVTIGQFARHVQATGAVTRAERDGGGQEYLGGWVRQPGTHWRRPDGVAADERLPAVHVTQPEAEAYCRWAGGRLPSAAEWQQAAYQEQRASPPAPFERGRRYPYPTGDQPTGANTREADAWPRAAPAGDTAAGVNGLHDMGANVWEWVADARGDERRTMGGSWWYGAEQMLESVEAWKPADFPAVYIGWRCVYERER